MFALYHEAEKEFVGIQTYSDCETICFILKGFSELDDEEPTLFVTQTRERAQSLIDSARKVYDGVIRFDASEFVGDFSCRIENITEYRVVKIGIIPEK
jgi:glutathionyl-hydroquinone reductase